jgi:hypothetical protein
MDYQGLPLAFSIEHAAETVGVADGTDGLIVEMTMGSAPGRFAVNDGVATQSFNGLNSMGTPLFGVTNIRYPNGNRKLLQVWGRPEFVRKIKFTGASADDDAEDATLYKVSALNIQACTGLVELQVQANLITAVDLSFAPSFQSLYAASNHGLLSASFVGCPSLRVVSMANCEYLETLAIPATAHCLYFNISSCTSLQMQNMFASPNFKVQRFFATDMGPSVLLDFPRIERRSPNSGTCDVYIGDNDLSASFLDYVVSRLPTNALLGGAPGRIAQLVLFSGNDCSLGDLSSTSQAKLASYTHANIS